MAIVFPSACRGAATRWVLVSGLHLLAAVVADTAAAGAGGAAACAAVAAATADALQGSTTAGESACLLQWEASAAKATKRAPGAAPDTAAAPAPVVAAAAALLSEEEHSSSNRSHGESRIAARSEDKIVGNVNHSLSNSSLHPGTTASLIEEGLQDIEPAVRVKAEESSVAATAEEEELEDNPDQPKPKKSKVILMILEMVPLCGPLGIDRFYLGATHTAIAKLIVCICTCLVGGLVWGLLDAIIVIINSLTRQSSIDSLGMVAEFSEDEVEPAHTLAVIGVVVQIFFCCGGPRFLSFVHSRLFGRKEPPPSATPASGPGASMLPGR